MLYVLVGDNHYSIKERIKELEEELKLPIVRPNIDSLTLDSLRQLLGGTSLFSTEEVVVLNGLSNNKEVFAPGVELLTKYHDQAKVILIETAFDKRTALFKKLKAVGQVEEFKQFSEREIPLVKKWLKSTLHSKGLEASPSFMDALIAWVGPQQEKLIMAVERLSLMDALTTKGVEEYIPKTPSSFAFELLAAALNKNSKKVMSTLDELKKTQDPYLLMGLITSQLVQVLALVRAPSHLATGVIAKDMGASPYALNNLSRSIKINSQQANKAIKYLYEADEGIKNSSLSPWQALSIALLRMTAL